MTVPAPFTRLEPVSDRLHEMAVTVTTSSTRPSSGAMSSARPMIETIFRALANDSPELQSSPRTEDDGEAAGGDEFLLSGDSGRRDEHIEALTDRMAFLCEVLQLKV